jgi:YidC/Oxa1 family membrane protein insertase
MLTALYDILIYPIELLVNYIYAFFFRFSDSHGIAIVGISVAITILSFPLYSIAEKIQQSERDVRKSLQGGIDRIKAVFSGDEQYMLLSTYYRQHNYHPAYALRSSISLLIQVPFFIAAYNFLSHLASLQGVSFLFITDLGKPDGLLTIGGITLNLLPIAMTLINIIAGLIYTKGFLVREKVQVFCMALLFLILLYTSPAGLVLYWTLNNVFSLIKNIFYKIKRPAFVLYVLIVVMVVVGSGLFIAGFFDITRLKEVLLLITGILLVCIPLELKAFKWLFTTFFTPLAQDNKQRKRLYIASALLLWVLCGLFIPSTLISSSPVEFAFTGMVENPLAYIVKTSVVFLGIAIVWPVAIYAMASIPAKTFLAVGFALVSLGSLANATVFQGDYGTISNFLVFDDATKLLAGRFLMLVPFAATLVLFLLLVVLVRKGKAKWITDLMMIIVVASFALSLYNIRTNNRDFNAHKQNVLANQADHTQGDEGPIYHLSKDGKNVIVFFLDRAVGAYFPYILQDVPDLAGQLQGFTYYPNTVSYATDTLLGSPALMGGYEYTPEAINERSEKTLVEKHNESLLLMPRLFYEAGYEVTFSDPPWPNYKWAGDYTPFEPYPGMDVFSTEGRYTNRYLNEHFEELSTDDLSTQIMANLPRFSLFRIAYPVLRNRLYDQGRYFSIVENENAMLPFLDMYSSLYYLPELIDYSAENDTFIFIDNETPHRQIDLEVSSFEPKKNVILGSAPIGDEQRLSRYDIQNYQVNAASMKRIGIWLEKLQRDGVYDNTRIIIVADHGAWSFNPLFAGFEDYRGIYGAYNPLLMVKDFNAVGPVLTDTTFMTNGDTPLLAIKDLVVSPVNPFTGKNLFDAVSKDAVNVYFGNWAPRHHATNTFIFDYDQSYTVKSDIAVESNWTPLKLGE